MSLANHDCRRCVAMENEVSVDWGAVIHEDLEDHPNSDPTFLQRSTLFTVLDLIPFKYEPWVSIRVRDPKRRAPVTGNIRVESESEQREAHIFLKSQEGRTRPF